MELVNSVYQGVINLQSDYIGFNVNLGGISSSLFSFLAAIGIFFILLAVGEMIRDKYFTDAIEPHLAFFISVALGYIVISTILAILGFFSLINTFTLVAVLLVCLAFILSNPSFLKKLGSIYNVHRFKKRVQENRFLHVVIIIFICIGFLKLFLPETGVDAVSYNTDYPHLYVQNQTTMLSAKGPEIYITVPQLGAMPYLIADFFGVREASRFIHYFFYLSVVLLLYIKNNKIGIYVVLLFVTSPVIIRLTSTAYTDFQWILCWLLAFFIINKRDVSLNKYLLAGILFGGALATKIWILAFFPVIIFYICFKNNHEKEKILFFLIGTFCISSIWYIRSFIISGNPVYPNFSSALGSSMFELSNYFTREAMLFKIINLINLSPIFVLITFFYLFKNTKTLSFSLPSFSLTTTVVLTYVLLPIFYFAGRYLLLGYSVLIEGLGDYAFQIKKNMLFSFISTALLVLMIGYYGITNVLLLPYAVGLANRDKYIERILARDNSSYYDYEKKFSKWISSSETVATYRLYGFYYANFRYKDIEYFMEKEKTITVLKKNNINKLLIKHGNMDWFCEEVGISDCDSSQYRLLAQYDRAQQYLYELK